MTSPFLLPIAPFLARWSASGGQENEVEQVLESLAAPRLLREEEPGTK